ncbi:polysialyltransferase family glycosyltransferase [Thiolapillus brandeum]|uniref:Uncharacterized protein n=1 Tax=Thiolapillus brandeum TaxID=1076588 RepID=A0A7U6GHD9_9GAMM|nr:polysialyltransferase family glycosyltransferase [Thiolapillus brandeum]BAO43683.1 conserved hypothetical protein [Thiolapillus brandeum]
MGLTKNIGFAITEYQQIVLGAVCRQEKLRFECIFVRENIRLNPALCQSADTVVTLRDIPYSWRSLPEYKREYEDVVRPHFIGGNEYLLFAHSIEHPLIKLAVKTLPSICVELIEEGVGSYVSWGRGFSNGDIRTRMSVFMIATGLLLYGGYGRIPTQRLKGGWSLYPNCFPDYPVESRHIRKEIFRETLEGFAPPGERIMFPKNSVVFIQQPYVEMGILDEATYIAIHEQAMASLKRISEQENEVIWMLHPRTHCEEEKQRLSKMTIDSTNIKVLQPSQGIEQVALSNKGNEIVYLSFGSSALYTLSLLIDKPDRLFQLENMVLKKLLPVQQEVNRFYRELGVPLL